ncbi:MAG: CotH kinase family protein [Deltaproteobacteria bacterium]|nr:CotH kinase family protein [Deltaproteobacteria bacterium]
MTASLSILWVLVCLAGGCDDSWHGPEEMEYDSFGLKKVISFSLTSEDISAMRNNTYAKPFVRTMVAIDGQPYPAGIAYCGATSVDDYKKSYEVELDNAYKGRRIYRINAMPTDLSASRAMLAYTIFEQMGFDMPMYEPVAVWINNAYAGMFLWQEKIDDTYFTARKKVPLSVYQAEDSVARMDDTANLDEEFSVKVGNKEMVDLKYMIQLLIQAPSAQNRAQLEEVLDVESVLKYMAITAYIAGHDGIVNNFYLARTKGDNRLTILPWDLDRTFYSTVPMEDGEFFDRNFMMSRFYHEEEPYGAKFKSLYRQVATLASPDVLGAALDTWVQKIRCAYENDPYLSISGTSLTQHVTDLKSRFAETAAAVNPLIPEQMAQ